MEISLKYTIKLGILVLVLFSVQTIGQSKEDSLKNILSTLSGEKRIRTLINFSQQNLYFDSKLSREFAEEALLLAQQAHDENNMAESYYYLGFSKYRLGYYQDALNDLYKSAETWKSLKNFNSLAAARNLTAIINYYIGRYEISTKLYSQNLVYYKAKNNMIYYSKMLTNLATVYLKKDDYDKALENLLTATSIAKQYAPNDAYYVGNVICNLGEAYFGKKQYDLALKNYMIALDYLKKINLTDGIANVQMDIGLAYVEMKKYDQAISYFNSALTNYLEIKYTKGVMDVKECIVRYYKTIKKPIKALEEIKSLELICSEAKDTVILAKCYYHYADIYQTLGNCPTAVKYYKDYFALKEKIEKEDNKQNMIGLQVLTDAEEKDMENMALKQENELQKTKIKINMLIFFSVIAVLILFSLFLFILYKKEKNIRKYAALLEKKNEEINNQNNKLEEVIQAKDKFFSILAHNLKNPFWAILGLNSVLKEDYDELADTEKRELISQIGGSVENVYNLFENLLKWAKTQQSAIKPYKEKLSVLELIYNSIKPYELRAKEKNVQIIVNADYGVSLFADKFMLETVLGNFVDNAIKFSKVNSSVKVMAVNLEKRISIIIEDTGIGMPKEKIERLFKIDEDISSEGTLNEKGTGLGLIICKEFVKLNNGEVKVESIENEGTKFIISFPAEN